jgi:hypothetical protein
MVLDYVYGVGLRAFVAIFYFELNALVLLEFLVAIALDS